jgi:radical SAM protein with 4Fe4S-binding SPASM domain
LRKKLLKKKIFFFWKSLIPLFAKLGANHFIITGGEPLLFKGIDKILLLAQKYGICELYTNATVEPSVFRKVLNYIDIIKISIDGHTKDQYGKTRNSKYFLNVLKNLEQVLQLNIPHYILVNIDKVTNINLEETICFLEFLGVNKIIFSPHLKYGLSLKEILEIFNLNGTIDLLSHKYSSVVNKSQIGFQFPKHSFLPGSVCGVFEDRFYITSDGFIAGCPLLSTQEYKFEYLLPFINNLHELELVFTRAKQKWLSMTSRSVCLKCMCLPSCGGWCPGVRGGLNKKCPSYIELNTR